MLKIKKFVYLLFFLLLVMLTGLIACTSRVPLIDPSVIKSDRGSDAGQAGQREEQRIAARVESLLAQLTLEEKISLVHAAGKFHVNAIERLGIPQMWLSDGPHGVRHQIERNSWNSAGWDNDHATYLPHLTSVAASWNVEMARLHGKVLGSEARHRGKDIILGPGVNLARLPLYGRNFEYMGEDPVLAAKLVVPEVLAIQAQDVAANVKHFALNNQELNRVGVNAKPDERTLREVYLPAFEAAVKQGKAYSIMGAYNQYYGTNVNQSKHLVMDILKGEWGFDGVLLTDWNVDINTYDAAVNGLDLEMGTQVDDYQDYFLARPLMAQIQSGKIPVSVLDDKVRRILRLQLRVGLMDNNRLPGQRNVKSHQLAAHAIAAEGVVLLKNDHQVLPLKREQVKNILVIGPNADKKHGSGGGSSEVKSLYEVTPLEGLRNMLGDEVNIEVLRARSSELSPIAPDYIAGRHWTGTPAWNLALYRDEARRELQRESWVVDAAYRVLPEAGQDAQTEHVVMSAEIKPQESGIHKLKVLAAGKFRLTLDGKTVIDYQGSGTKIYQQAIPLTAGQGYQFRIDYDGKAHFTLGWDAPGNLFSSEQAYLTAAKKADAVIYFGGLSHSDDRESIDRPDMVLPNNQDEIISKLLAANPNTVVFMVAGSAVEMPWAQQARAIVWGWYGGMEAGNAFADVLFGNINPSGKLPITLPKSLADTAPIALNDYNASESLYREGVFIGHRWFEKQGITPSFAFGHGLSYTSFDYSQLKLSTKTLSGDEPLTVTATVTNTGKVAGAEVVQLYLHDVKASVPRPAKELKGFAKVYLQPGESQQVSIELNKRDLSFWDVTSNNWLAEPGDFEVILAASAQDIRGKLSFSYSP